MTLLEREVWEALRTQVGAALPRLQKAMYPERASGTSGEVLDDGEIVIGDPVRWLE